MDSVVETFGDLLDEAGNPLTDLLAEQTLVGALLWHPELAPGLRDVLSPEDFFERPLGRVFEGLVKLDGLTPENDQVLAWLGGDKVEIAGRSGKHLVGYLRGIGNAVEEGGANELAQRVFEVAERRLTGEGETILAGLDGWQSKMGMLAFADRSSFVANEPDFIVEDLIPERELVLIMGEKQTGKSFATTHLGFCIAQAKPFFGRRILEPRPVIWCCYEGGTGARRRMTAYANYFNVQAEIPFAALTEPFDLWANEKNVEELIKEVGGACRALVGVKKPPVLIIDTHNAATSGASEIDSEVVSKIRERYKSIVRALEATVIIVGHTNALGKHRGNEQLANNVPTILTVSYKTRIDNRQPVQVTDNDGRPVRSLLIKAQREGETGKSFDFVLHGVNTGIKDKFGKEKTSCVVAEPNLTPSEKEEGGNSRQQQRVKMLGPIQTGYFKVFWEALQEYGEAAPANLNLPRSTRVVKTAYVLKIWNQRQSPDMNANTSKTRRQRAETWFQNKNVLRIDNDAGVMWWTGRYVADLEETHSRQRSMFDDATERSMLPADDFPPDD